MQEKTKADYKKLATYFYATHIPGQPPSPKRIKDALAKFAPECRPNYWLRLRGALAFDQEEKGYKEVAELLRKMKNPVREKGLPIKPKQRRVKTISDIDEERLIEALFRVEDTPVISGLYIAKFTGVRPAEMWDLRIRDGRVVVIGAKKSHSGQRGADREILIDPSLMETMQSLIAGLRSKGDKDVAAIQHRLRNTCEKLWPRRKAWPTLYTWRHQMGSNLRAAGLDRLEVAYIMGHQSTKSVDQYGDKRTANTGTLLPRVPEGTDLSRIRVKHREFKLAAPDPDFDFGFD